jgi:hypothetical protein
MLWSAWILVGWAALLRWAAPLDPDSGAAPWAWLTDGAAVVIAGIGFFVATTLWFPKYYLLNTALVASDFAQYCESVGAAQAGALGLVHPQRSMYESLLPGLLARGYGIMGGFVLSAAIAQMLTGAGIYVWARTIGGRVAGFAAVLLGSTMLPVALLGRTMTFYPQTVAVMVCAAATAAVAANARTATTMVLAGAGAGMALLWDVRGLYWAIAVIGTAVVAGIAGPPGEPVSWRRRLAGVGGRIALLGLPLALSWWIAHTYTPWNAQGLTVQTINFARDAPGAVGGAWSRPHYDFVWGRTAFSDILPALREVAALNRAVGAGISAHGLGLATVVPWVWPVGVCLLAMFWSLRRNPWTIFGFLAPAIPFAASLWSAIYVNGHPRYLGVGMPCFAVCAGSGLALLLCGQGGRAPQQWRAPIVVGVLGLLVTGVVPGWLSPVAPWRSKFAGEQYPGVMLADPPSPLVADARCVALLAEDRVHQRQWPLYDAPAR